MGASPTLLHMRRLTEYVPVLCDVCRPPEVQQGTARHAHAATAFLLRQPSRAWRDTGELDDHFRYRASRHRAQILFALNFGSSLHFCTCQYILRSLDMVCHLDSHIVKGEWWSYKIHI